jgi:hypothetical protein
LIGYLRVRVRQRQSSKLHALLASKRIGANRAIWATTALDCTQSSEDPTMRLPYSTVQYSHFRKLKAAENELDRIRLVPDWSDLDSDSNLYRNHHASNRKKQCAIKVVYKLVSYTYHHIGLVDKKSS